MKMNKLIFALIAVMLCLFLAACGGKKTSVDTPVVTPTETPTASEQTETPTAPTETPVEPTETPTETPVSGDLTFSLDKVEGKAGENVTVKVSISNNPGLAGFSVSVVYDPEKLEYVSAQNKVPGGYSTENCEKVEVEDEEGKTIKKEKGILHVMSTLAGLNPVTLNDVCYEVTFKIKNGTPAGEIPLSLKLVEPLDRVYQVSADFKSYPDVPAVFADGSVTVVG